MKKLLSVAMLTAIGFLSLNSCKKADPDPLGDWTCTCFVTHTVGGVLIARDTAYLKETKMEKSIATTYCNNAQASYTDTFGSFGQCTLR